MSLFSALPKTSDSEPSYITITEDQSAGQTFVSRHAGLNAISLQIIPSVPGSGNITLSLFDDADSEKPLATSTLPLSEVEEVGWYRFNFSFQPSSYFRYYFFQLMISGQGQVMIPLRNGGNLSVEGSIYLQDHPADGEIVAVFEFDRWAKTWGLVNQFIRWSRDFLIGFIVFCLPGFLISLRLFKQMSWINCLAIGSGIGLSIYFIYFLLAYILNVRTGELFTWIVTIGSLVIAGYQGFLAIKQNQRKPVWSLFFYSGWYKSPEYSLLLVLIFVVFSRFWAIRGLPAPLGSDAIQHGAITQLILDHNGLFQSWLPYTPYQTFTTHFGFHVLSAMYTWVSHKNILESILISGQVLNVLSVFALYPFAVLITKGNRWAGVWSVFVAGLMFSMPAYYVNWSRYPQLTGQLVLISSLCLFVIALNIKNSQWVLPAIFTGLLVAGSFFAYYRMVFFFGAFLLAWMIVEGVTLYRLSFEYWKKSLVRIFVVGVISLLFVVPWLGVISSSRLSNEEIHGTINQVKQVIVDLQIWRTISFYAPPTALVLSLAGLVISLLKKNWHSLTVLMWYILLSSIVILSLVGLPGASLMQSTVTIISLYIPFGILGGIFLGFIFDWWERKPFSLSAVFPIIFVAGGIWFTPGVARIANPNSHTFLSWADLEAMDWIRSNIPLEAKFFVNTQRFKETSAIGADAGWWLPILTDRENNIPPQYALVMETPYEPGYNQKVLELTFDLEKNSLASPSGLRMLCDEGYEYIYIGQQLGYTGPEAEQSLITPHQFVDSNKFQKVYQHNRVTILKLNTSVCQTD